MTKLPTILTLALATLSAFASTGCADLERSEKDFGFSQDFAFSETGDEWGDEAGNEDGQAESGQDEGAEPLVPGFEEPGLTCGDGEIEGREECDDGELNGITEGCTPGCMFNVCGDGFLLVGIEDCDTGALNGIEQNGSLCTETCELVAPQ